MEEEIVFETLRVTEIYHSIQGESSFSGQRCIFVRLTGCNLRCNYCDTKYAFYGGKTVSVEEVLEQVKELECELVEITGGEPLLQESVYSLMSMLCDAGKKVLLETSGNRDISRVDPRVSIIMDLKTPSSGECERNREENLPLLKEKDEVKFVIGSEDDYLWSRDAVKNHKLNDRCGNVIFSPVFGEINSNEIVEWIVRDRLDVRFQLQIHKYIWDPNEKGV